VKVPWYQLGTPQRDLRIGCLMYRPPGLPPSGPPPSVSGPAIPNQPLPYGSGYGAPNARPVGVPGYPPPGPPPTMQAPGSAYPGSMSLPPHSTAPGAPQNAPGSTPYAPYGMGAPPTSMPPPIGAASGPHPLPPQSYGGYGGQPIPPPMSFTPGQPGPPPPVSAPPPYSQPGPMSMMPEPSYGGSNIPQQPSGPPQPPPSTMGASKPSAAKRYYPLPTDAGTTALVTPPPAPVSMAGGTQPQSQSGYPPASAYGAASQPAPPPMYSPPPGSHVQSAQPSYSMAGTPPVDSFQSLSLNAPQPPPSGPGPGYGSYAPPTGPPPPPGSSYGGPPPPGMQGPPMAGQPQMAQPPPSIPLSSISSGTMTGAPQAAGTSASGSRIDPSQIPRPASQIDANDPNQMQRYQTRSQGAPPPAVSRFVAVDEGNCSPRFMRLTVNHVANTADLLNTSNLPLAVILSPLAQISPEEEPVPVVDCGESGPIRCRRCRCYINPLMVFVDQGRRFVCNLCGMSNEVPGHYFSNLDGHGKRRDIAVRPELTHGSVDFVATQEYIMRPPNPPAYIFLIDVSYAAVASQVTSMTTAAIRDALDRIVSPDNTRIGIATYDKAVHFYNLKRPSGPQMLVVPDVDDVFLPLPEELLLPLGPHREAIYNLLALIPNMFQATQVSMTSAAAAINAGFLALKATGGRVVCFQSMLSTVGPGKLKQRDDTRLYGTDKEKTLLAPQEQFYKDLAKDCAASQVSVHLFLFAQSYIDVATMGVLTSSTCGDLMFYPGFVAQRDGDKFCEELIRMVTRQSGYEAVMRVRCSAGLCVKEYLGPYLQRTADDMDLANIDADKSFAVVLKHDDKLPEQTEACIQAALLYTNQYGERRIRVHTLSVPVTSVLGNLFRYADLDTIMNLAARQSVVTALQQPLEKVRTNATASCVDILYSYRKYCCSNNQSSSGQLILPEALKLLPLYTLALLKSVAFRSGTDVRVDERAYLMQEISQMNAAFSTQFVYPRLFALHSIPPGCGVPIGPNAEIIMPPPIPLTSERLEAEGAFILDDGLSMFLWLGRSISPMWLSDVFGVPPGTSLEEIDCSQLQLVRLDNEMNNKVYNIVRALRGSLPRGGTVYPALRIIKTRDPLESRFLSHLVEDRHSQVYSYVEFLCHIHRQIQNRLS